MSSSLPQPSQLRKRRVVSSVPNSHARSCVYLPRLILFFKTGQGPGSELDSRTSVQEIDERITARLQTSEALLRAGTGLFAASDEVAPQEFDRFVQQIELQKNYPGIQGIGFSQRLRPDEKADLIAKMRQSGFSDFKIWPEYQRDEYNAIIYLQPMNNRNQVAIGFDMFTGSGAPPGDGDCRAIQGRRLLQDA